MDLIGYLRVSTDEQAKSGLGLQAQRQAIQRAVKGRGCRLHWLEDDGYSGKDLRRPSIRQALTMLKARKADGIIVARQDRLSRSVLDLAELRARARREGWALVALDLPLDTTTASGSLSANIGASVAQHYRDYVSERTREALAVKRAQGVRLGRPPVKWNSRAKVVGRIQRARRRGDSYLTIARALNADGVPTPCKGDEWYPYSVWAALPGNAKRRATQRVERTQRSSLIFKAINGN